MALQRRGSYFAESFERRGMNEPTISEGERMRRQREAERARYGLSRRGETAQPQASDQPTAGQLAVARVRQDAYNQGLSVMNDAGRMVTKPAAQPVVPDPPDIPAAPTATPAPVVELDTGVPSVQPLSPVTSRRRGIRRRREMGN